MNITVIKSVLNYQIIKKWNDFERDTLGKQLIRSADSISSGSGKRTSNNQIIYHSKYSNIFPR